MPDAIAHLAGNLAYLVKIRGGGQKALAADLGVHPGTVSKLVNGKFPHSKLLDRVAELAGISRDDFLKPHSEFKKVLDGQAPGKSVEVPFKKGKIRVQFNCTENNRYLWREFFKRHEGEYVMYHPLPQKPGFVAASLLRVHTLDKVRGIEFSLSNPAYTEDGRLYIYEYDGLAFPVSDYFYLFAEQRDGNYEIISMILDQAPEPVPDILEGRVLGIGVRHGTKCVTGIPVVLKFKPGGFEEWKSLLGQEFGELELAQLPTAIQSKLIS